MLNEPPQTQCPTCTMIHKQKPESPGEGFDLNDCLMNALGEIGEFATRKGEYERAIARLYREIEEKEDEIEELERDLKILTDEVDD